MWGSDKSRDKPVAEKAESKDRPKAAAKASKPQKSQKAPRAASSVDTLIGKDTMIRGDVHFTGGLHIDGCVKGRVIAEEDAGAVVSISESGIVEGSIRSPFVVVNGLAEGDIHALERISLSPSAKVIGNIYYKLIELPAGATVNGQMFYDDDSMKVAALPSNSEFEAVSDGVSAGESAGASQKTRL